MVGGDESTLAHEGDDGQAQPAVNGRDGARGRNPGTACFRWTSPAGIPAGLSPSAGVTRG